MCETYSFFSGKIHICRLIYVQYNLGAITYDVVTHGERGVVMNNPHYHERNDNESESTEKNNSHRKESFNFNDGCNGRGGSNMEYIKELLKARAEALLPVTIVRQDNNVTYTNVQVAFVKDSAVGIAVGSSIRVIPFSAILEVR